MVNHPQETYVLAECAVLCIEYMINVIIDIHQEMFYRTAGLEISSRENISCGAFNQN